MTSTHVIIFLLLLRFSLPSAAYGSMGPIAAAFGPSGFFCAIDASGKQAVVCWGKNITEDPSNSPSNPPPFAAGVPPVAALSGGENFLCGLLSNTSQAYCWDSQGTQILFETTSYSYISAGKNHVCAVRGFYYSDFDSGLVDCWDILKDSDNKLISKQNSLFSETNLSFKKVVSGDDFSCGDIKNGGIACSGPNSHNFVNISNFPDNYSTLASGLSSVCAISENTGEIKCWGSDDSVNNYPTGTRFVSLTAGADHFCAIREDDHEVNCWGDFNSSIIPKGSSFSAIASSDSITCGIRESDLVLDCFFSDENLKPDYDPPLQLCSPGLCTLGPCGENKFAYNASILNEPDLTNLCVRKELYICSPCGYNCSQGFFVSSPCGPNSDRVCTSCSLCQNSSCSDVCEMQKLKETYHDHKLSKLILILGSSVSGFLLFLIGCCLLNYIGITKRKDGSKKFGACIGKDEKNDDENAVPERENSLSTHPGAAQIFRLSELKDATNGFKEFNELGRGSYGFVYKAVLADGRQVAVKRANAATIIHSNTREFEMELEILCNIRHANIVNLLGYCSEMGERLLVYEYMPHGTLHDHLHGGLSPLNWNHRLKIALQAAKGLEYLHNEVVPSIIHRDVKSSNILLDFDYNARIADFGLLSSSSNERDFKGEMRDDVYKFGVVLLEILSGRKGYDRECTPPSIAEWALNLIRKGKSAAIIDRYVALPRNVEPLLRLAEIAEVAVRENSCERPNMADVAAALEQLVRDGLVS